MAAVALPVHIRCDPPSSQGTSTWSKPHQVVLLTQVLGSQAAGVSVVLVSGAGDGAPVSVPLVSGPGDTSAVVGTAQAGWPSTTLHSSPAALECVLQFC